MYIRIRCKLKKYHSNHQPARVLRSSIYAIGEFGRRPSVLSSPTPFKVISPAALELLGSKFAGEGLPRLSIPAWPVSCFCCSGSSLLERSHQATSSAGLCFMLFGLQMFPAPLILKSRRCNRCKLLRTPYHRAIPHNWRSIHPILSKSLGLWFVPQLKLTPPSIAGNHWPQRLRILLQFHEKIVELLVVQIFTWPPHASPWGQEVLPPKNIKKLSTSPSTYPSTYLSIYPSLYLCIYPSVHPSI